MIVLIGLLVNAMLRLLFPRKSVFTKPSLSDFVSEYPSYAAPEYQEKLTEVMQEAFILYREQISALPLDSQSLAYKFAVCHLFALSCWEDMGFAAPPQEMNSRNDKVVFKSSVQGLKGTACGLKLLTLFRKNNVGFVYASSIGTSCPTSKCGGSIDKRSFY